MTIDLNSFNQATQNDPIQKAVADLCAKGVTINRIIFNEGDGDSPHV